MPHKHCNEEEPVMTCLYFNEHICCGNSMKQFQINFIIDLRGVFYVVRYKYNIRITLSR